MKLQFEVKGQAYFLNFDDPQKQWFLIRPTNTGVLAIPVYVDAANYDRVPVGGIDRRDIRN